MCVHGNPNVLTRDVGTSRLAQGCSGQHALVEVERFDGALPPVRAFEPPRIAERRRRMTPRRRDPTRPLRRVAGPSRSCATAGTRSRAETSCRVRRSRARSSTSRWCSSATAGARVGAARSLRASQRAALARRRGRVGPHRVPVSRLALRRTRDLPRRAGPAERERSARAAAFPRFATRRAGRLPLDLGPARRRARGLCRCASRTSTIPTTSPCCASTTSSARCTRRSRTRSTCRTRPSSIAATSAARRAARSRRCDAAFRAASRSSTSASRRSPARRRTPRARRSCRSTGIASSCPASRRSSTGPAAAGTRSARCRTRR